MYVGPSTIKILYITCVYMIIYGQLFSKSASLEPLLLLLESSATATGKKIDLESVCNILNYYEIERYPSIVISFRLFQRKIIGLEHSDFSSNSETTSSLRRVWFYFFTLKAAYLIRLRTKCLYWCADTVILVYTTQYLVFQVPQNEKDFPDI